MVTIINFKERNKEDGTSFFVLEVQGGIEMVQSKVTGNFYATAKKAYLPSTFDAMTCQALIGTQMQGSIEKEACEPYEYTVKETGEIIILTHRYCYLPEENEKSKSTYDSFKTSVETFSLNDKHEMANV
ncbi:hypothetical protein GOQ30_05205 [Flavobacterium sp. TP390]|uniref:Uncharacterized protein n=1 Tax=Flavobacterium profundi TaxID=1774945 RepID=A0A6I4IG05_9FLAO|nr:hypothetical protein [Flavobacterium profundi]MVO08558.1 hypothetical protein [Flavobacterium profundi]